MLSDDNIFFVLVSNYNSHNGWFLKHTASKKSPFVIYSLNSNKGNRQHLVSINSFDFDESSLFSQMFTGGH